MGDITYPTFVKRLLDEAFQEALKRKSMAEGRLSAEKYQSRPAAFGRDFLGHRYTNDVKRLMQSVVDNPITIARSSMGTGKSHSAAAMAVWFYKAFPDSQVYVTAAPPLDNLKNILWGEILDTVHRHPEHFEEDKITDLRIDKGKNKSFITGVTIPMTGTAAERKAKFAGKHAPHLFFIVDEGDAVPFEVYEGIDGCMSGGMARLLIMFNPRAQTGPIYEKEAKRQANVVHLSAFRHPNVTSGKDIIPGAVTRETVVRRINEWTRPLVEGEVANPADSFAIPDFLEGAVAKSLNGDEYPPLPGGARVVVEPAFSYMVLGEYPAQAENQLISREWIDAARKRWDDYVAEHGEVPPSGLYPRLGLDVAEYGPDFNVPVFRYDSYVPRIRRIWQGVDTTYTADIAADICRNSGVSVVAVDGTGAGSGVASMIGRNVKGSGIRAMSVKVANSPGTFLRTELGEFYQLRDQLWWALREWLRKPENNAMLPPEPMLIEELLCPNYTIQNNGKIYVMNKDDMRAKLRRSPNYADALALTFVPAEKAHVIRLGD